MNLGKRIELRLNELGWERSDLLSLVPDLTPQRLSALIKRDSRRCELDLQIANALGVHLHWLNDGVAPKLITDGATGRQNDHQSSLSPRARRLISRIEAAESSGSSSPQLLALIEAALDMAQPLATKDGYAGLSQLKEE